MFASILTAALLAVPAFAAVSITEPVASTSWAAGVQQTIQWQDDGQTYNLTAFGLSEVGVWAGNQIQQTELQMIVASVDVSTTSSITFTPLATIGPDGDYYFIRFTSINMKQAANPMYPEEAFSAKFTLTGMTGTFNATVQAEVNAASSVGAPGAPSTGAPASPSAPAGSVPPAASTPAGASSAGAPKSSGAPTSASHSAAPSTTGAAKTNGASGLAASVGIVGTVIALAGAMLF